MGAWELKGPVRGSWWTWRDAFPALATEVERVTAPKGRGIAWEGAEIWAYKTGPKDIVEVFKKNSRKFRDREAYVFHPGGQRMTWGQTADKVNRAAYRLRHEYGFVKGDRFGLLTAGSPEFVIGYLAALTLGGIAVPVNLGLTAAGIVAQINKVGAKALVVSPEIWAEKIGAVLNELSSKPAIFTTGEVALGGTEYTVPFHRLTDGEVSAEVVEEIDEWDVCAISFTSGTTGAPKGTMAMHINAAGCARAVMDAAKGLGPDDINICMPPLYHNTAVYTDFMPALMSGGKTIVLASFNPLEAIKLIERERATWAVAAPIMLWMMMNHPEFRSHDCTTLKKIVFGGHASSETFINQLHESFAPIAMVNGGSVSESTALGFALPTEDALRKITSCGLATPNSEIAIFDEDGNEIREPNLIGEVAYKGQQTNAGYWREPGKTSEVFRKDGYVLSGDWAKFDVDGYLWLLDRKKDMIVRGGQNVYCIEVENKLFMHPKILRAAVVGVPDHVFSERVKAVVVLKPDQEMSCSEIREHCEKYLAHYEIPEYVVFANAIATNPAGKTLKAPLVDFWGESDERKDPALAKFGNFCAAMPSALLDREQLKMGGLAITPRAALKDLQDDTERGRQLKRMISEKGLVELLKPNKSRFRT